jgi:ATP-binding cassette, subfamily C, bacterial CydC
MKTILRLLGFLRPYWGSVFLSVLLGIGAVSAGIGLMGTSAYLIARAGQHPSIAVLQVAIVGVRFLGLSRGIFRYFERLVSHSVNFRLLAELRVWFYRRIEPIAPAGLINQRSGDLLSRAVSDIETLENFYVRAVGPLITAVCVTLGMSLFTGYFHPVLGWMLAGGMILAGFVLPGITFWMSRSPASWWVTQRGETRSFLVESLQGMADLISFGQMAEREKQLAFQNEIQAKSERKLALVSSFSTGMGLLIVNLTMAAILFVGTDLVRSGSLNGINLAVVCLMALASFEVAGPLQNAFRQMEKSIEAGRRLFNIPGEPIRQTPLKLMSPQPNNEGIRLVDLSFSYDDQTQVLNSINLSLVPGKKVGMAGASGAGKTTLVNLLLRFWDAPDGTYLLDGQDVKGLDKNDVCSRFSVVSQNTYLFSTSIRQNLLLAKRDCQDEELLHVLELVGLGPWLRNLKDGLDSWIGENGLHLSGGERQRLSAARALLKNAPYLILDEPGSHLDPLGEDRLLEFLLASSPDRGLLLITHHLDSLAKMDEIIYLEDGAVIERGVFEELLASGGKFARLWALEQEFLPE